jgi:hypothetical protein
VIGGIHGHDIGVHKLIYSPMFDLTVVNSFIAGSKSTAEHFKQARELHPVSRKKRPEIVYFGYNSFSGLRKTNHVNPGKASVKTVMAVEYPLTPFHHPSRTLFWHIQLRTTLLFARCARKAGISPWIKKHPDRLSESEGMYEPFFDKIYTEPFEQVYMNADAYFLPHLSSSTMALILLSSKPVFLFDWLLFDVWDSFAEILYKRCIIIKSSYSGDGIFQFDEEQLLTALKQSPSHVQQKCIDPVINLLS